MKILVTNDDGYQAKGIATIKRILEQFGDLTVVAPKNPQSGMSMAVTMGFRPIAVKKLSENEYYLDGTPASCIKYGIDNVLWPDKPDLVVSGINHGSNAATAAAYSGTIGAAMEGAANGIASIGVSLDTFDPNADFSVVEEFLPGILEKLLKVMMPKRGLYYNINFPCIPPSEIKGVKLCRLGSVRWEKEYRDFYKFLEEMGRTPRPEDLDYIARKEEGEEIYVMAGDMVSNDGNPESADHLWMEKGYIVIVPQNIDNTDTEEFSRLCGIF